MLEIRERQQLDMRQVIDDTEESRRLVCISLPLLIFFFSLACSKSEFITISFVFLSAFKVNENINVNLNSTVFQEAERKAEEARQKALKENEKKMKSYKVTMGHALGTAGNY